MFSPRSAAALAPMISGGDGPTTTAQGENVRQKLFASMHEDEGKAKEVKRLEDEIRDRQRLLSQLTNPPEDVKLEFKTPEAFKTHGQGGSPVGAPFVFSLRAHFSDLSGHVLVIRESFCCSFGGHGLLIWG